MSEDRTKFRAAARRCLWMAVCLAGAMAGAGLLASCERKASGAGASKAPTTAPVRVCEVTTRPVPIELATFGRVEADSSVSVKAEVTGILTEVLVRKGQYVKKDAHLFTIDPRPYKAALDQAEATRDQAQASQEQAQAKLRQTQANLERDEFLAKQARKDADREAALGKKQYASDTEVEKAQADAAAFEATVKADEAAVKSDAAAVHADEALVKADEAAIASARLQWERCVIRAPEDGLAGLDVADAGNLVKAGDMTLVVIKKVHPVQVFFSIPEQNLPLVKKYMQAGRAAGNGAKGLAVRVKPRGADEANISGALTSVDNTVDPTSGTIRLGATFENQDERLWPGDYVDVVLVLAEQKDAVVAPARAVQTGRESKYVFVVKADNTAELRPVTVRRISSEEVVVDRGLRAGERVVTDGQLRLTDGAAVEIVPEAEKDKTKRPEKAPEAEKKTGSQGAAL